jgi:hypothetical protein
MGFIHKTGNTQEVLVNGAGVDHPVAEGFMYAEGSPPDGYFMTTALEVKSPAQRAQEILDENFSPEMLATLVTVIPGLERFLQVGTEKSLAAARLVLLAAQLPADLEDERQSLLNLFGG